MSFQKDLPNIKLIIASLAKAGITNHFMQAGILAVVSTEGSFTPKSESSYGKTPNDRLRLLFGKRLAAYNDNDLSTLKRDDLRFFDAIYGGQYGNLAAGDGWRYRGRGFNQITFRNTYQKACVWSGVDLITSPDRLNEPQIAADSLAGLFAEGLAGHNAELVKDLDSANLMAFHVNAGWGTDLTRGWLKTEREHQMANIEELYKFVTT